MSFLKAMQKTNATTTEGAAAPTPKKVNPLLSKASKPNPLAKAKEEASTESKEEAKAPAKKPSPLLKKKAEAPAPTEEKSVKAKAIDDAKKQIVEDVKAEVEIETQAEEPKVEETVVEATEQVVPEVKAKTVEKPAEKPKSKRNTKKKTPKVAEENTQEAGAVEVYTTQMSFADAMAAIRSPFVDEEWETFKQEIAEELNGIEINSDMNAATMKQAVADLSSIRQKVWFDFQEVKTQYDSIASKEPEGIIERVKKVNIGDGSNDLQRKKAGVEACMRYVSPGTDEPINLFELLDEIRGRFNFLKNVLDSVEYKTKVLITMSSALKLEGQHIGAEV